MADSNNSVCFSFVEFVSNGIRQCFGLEDVHAGAVAPAGTSDDAKPLIPEQEEEEISSVNVSISEEISTATNYYPPVIADQETPSTENNDSPPPVVQVYAAPLSRLQTVTKGSGPKTN